MTSELLWICRGCKSEFGEYINGCPICWEDDLSIEENQAKYPDRKVVLKREKSNSL